MADLNENSDDPDLSEILNSNATYENDSDLLDIFSKSVPLDVFKLEPSSQLTTQVDVQSTQTGVVQKHLCTDNEDKSIVSTFKPDESMSTQDIVLAEHCYSRSGNDTFNDFDSASNLQIASPKQSKRNKRSDRNKDKNKPQDKGSKMKKKRGRKPKKGAEIKEESDAVLIDSTMNNDKIEDSSDDAKSSLYIKPEIKSEDLEVPFDKDGKLYGTISKLTDNKKTDSSIKNENENEMEKTIIKEDASSANLSTPSYSGRSQRIRKKPKRWDDDQVEVDFTGQSNLFGLDDSKNKKKEDTKSEDSARKRQKSQTKVNNSKIIKKEETVEEEDSESSSDDNDNNDSNFSSDDDSDKLWCFCRKPYNERFMISCDACEEWFHGKCVNVTKVQGNKMEKLKQEWFCKSCLDGLENNVSREELKRLAEIKRLKIEEEERAAKAKKKKKTSKIKERKSTNKVIESTIIIREEIEVKQEDEMSSDHSDLDVSKVSQKSNKSPKVLKDLRKESKESEDRRKLQKLIKASKKDLNEKLKVKEERTQSVDSNLDQSEQSTTSIDQSQSSSTTNTNHVVPLTPTEEFPKVAVPVPKPKGELTPKKKHKTDPVDVSVQDLFKAEPVLMRSMSTSSASPSTSSSLSSHRKSSGSFELRRTSTSSTNSTLPVLMNGDEISCPSGCGKTIRMDLNDSNLSIYCNSNCLQTHVSDALKCLRSYKKHKDKDKSIPPDQQKPLRVVLYNRANGKIKSGKDALLEKDVLSFITKNPVFEVFKPNAITNSKANNVHNHHQQNSHKSAQSNTNNTSHKNNSSHKTQNDSKKSQSAVSSNNASSSSKLERSSSISERPDDRRKYLRKHLREIFDTRHKELNDNDKAKINPDSFSKLSSNIEEELYKAFKSNSHKYNNKSRSLIFNLKDHKNNLYRKVLLGRITPERLVNMSPEELASSELARWRENEKKTMIELIKRDAEDQANQIIVKKTHKGEEFITGNDLIELPLSEPANKNDSSKDLNSVEKLSSEATTKIAPASLASIKSEPILSCFDVLDTTSQHKHHVYSNNCKICIVKSTDKSTDKKTSVSSATPPVLSSQISKESTDTQNHRSQPKRVRIELESTSKFLEEAVKLSDKLKLESQQTPLITSESSNDTNATTPVKTSPKLVTAKPTETKNPELGGSSKAIWKGTIFMQDVAKFVASAHNISGTIAANLLQDINDQITVCGRITPEQVCDYISKLRSSKRTEIGIVQFSWASREERTGYDAFFNYLNVRGRYGVVSYSGKTFKDFYILPLSHNQEIPKILHPIEGPGVAKKMHRPNLLLGILIRSRKFSPSHPTNIPLTSAVSQSTHDSVATSSTLPERSYTPPPLSNYETPLQEEVNTGSYTPPQMPPAKRHLSDSGSHDLGSKVPKYDPEETKVNTSKSSSAYMNDLMEKVASSSNPVEMTSSVLSAIATSDNYELQKRLLDQLTEKVEGQRRLLEKQKQETEDKISTNTSLSSLPNSLSSVAGSNSVSIDSVFNNIKNIQIPDNIKDILKTVQEKTSQIEAQQARLRAVSGSMNATLEDFDHPDPNSNNSNNDFLNKTAANDPRLRSKKATSIHTEGSSEIPPLPTAQPVASMSQDELLRKAQEQMAALAQMESDSVTPSFPHVPTEKEQKFVPPMPALSGPFREKVTPSAPLTKTTESRTSMPKISFQWKRKK